MNLQLVRDTFTDQSTTGKLYVDHVFQCYVLEDARHDHKIAGKTCIANGKYEVVVNWSDRFKKSMPLLIGVPGFSGIRIHCGNTAADTEGCLLVGSSRENDVVRGSRLAFDALFPFIVSACKVGKVFIEISDV